MIRCPLCEHTQAAGTECEACGRRLVAAGPAKVAAAPIPELELTSHSQGRAAVAVARLTELEGTLHEPEPDWPGEDVADLQRTSFEPVAVAAAPVMTELDRHRAPTDGQKTQLNAAAGITCRYCRHVQASGVMCDRCGMRLPKLPSSAPTQASGARAGKAEPVKTRCRACGAPAKGGQPCGDCGRLVPMPEA